MFAILVIFVWNGNTLLAHVDFIVSIANPFLDWYLISRFVANDGLSPGEITSEALLLFYTTGRIWWRSISFEVPPAGSLPVLDSLNLVWTTKSAKLVSRILPDLTEEWDSLVEQWGRDAFRGMCLCENRMFVALYFQSILTPLLAAHVHKSLSCINLCD